MPRRPRRSRQAARPAPEPPPLRGGWVREEGGWIVRSISGTAATKSYRCPGCDQEIPPGTPHVVAWPSGDEAERRSTRGVSEPEGTVERRHWHTRCWQRAKR